MKSALFLAIIVIAFSAMKDAGELAKTRWISLPEAEKSLKTERRPILIDLYTDWCGWCKVMDKNTYGDARVAAYLDKKFYAVKFNAEGKGEIEFNGRRFKFNPQYRTHDLAIYLTQGQLSYPSTVIIPADGSSPQVIPGYLKPADFEKILKYFGEGHFGKLSFQQFERSFKAEWR